jgi:hypothetical protein
VCLVGTAIMTASFLPAALGMAGRSPVMWETSLVLLGMGSALSVVPAFTAANVAVRPAQIPDSVALVNILLRVGGVLGTSLAVALIGEQSLHSPPDPGRFRGAFWMLAVTSALAWACSLWVTHANSPPATRSEAGSA